METDTTISYVKDGVVTLAGVVARLEDLLGKEARIVIGVHDLPFEKLEHVRNLRVLKIEGERIWLTGEVYVGEHVITVHSRNLPRTIAEEPEQETPSHDELAAALS